MIGLTWNTMMSFGGGWFFVAASEAISMLNQDYRLPGIGAYVTEAIDQQNFGALIAAIVAMAIMIVLVDQLVWRPLIAWSQKFRNEQSEASKTPTSWVLDLWRAARLPTMIGGASRPTGEFVNRALSGTLTHRPSRMTPPRPLPLRWVDRAYNGLLITLAASSGLGALCRAVRV